MKVYRFYDIQYSAGCDECGNDLGPGRVGVHLRTFNVIKETPCGVWIDIGYNTFGSPFIPKECQKWINLKAHNKYACCTKEEALQSFILRKRRQMRIFLARIERAKKALIEADKMQRSKLNEHATDNIGCLPAIT